MARIWEWQNPNNPPEPDGSESTLHVRTTKRSYLLERPNLPDDTHTWRPVVAPGNTKLWNDWVENWGPLTAVEE